MYKVQPVKDLCRICLKTTQVFSKPHQVRLTPCRQILQPNIENRLSNNGFFQQLCMRTTNTKPPKFVNINSSVRQKYAPVVKNSKLQVPPVTVGLHVPVVLRNFHTSSRRNVPPFIWLFIKPLAKVGAILTGRGARKWWQALPRDKKFVVLGKVLERWHLYMIGGLSLLTGGIVYYRVHLEDSPITGRRRFIAFTPPQFMKIVQAEADMYVEQFNDTLLPLNNPKVERVKRVTMRLVNGNNELKDMMNTEWSICVVDDPVKNAFVLPSGHIFVFTGILDFMDNDDQLAIVIGHEMSHALLSHAAEQISFAQLIDVFVIGVMAAIWTIMPTDGLAVVTQWFYNKCIQLMLEMPYSRKLEQEADKVGLQLAAKACFDVREGSVFWTKMALCEEEEDKVPEWLSTHPLNDKRVEHINFLMSDALKLRDESRCPRLVSSDPRERIKMVSKMVDDDKLAILSRRNLRQVTHAHPGDRPVMK